MNILLITDDFYPNQGGIAQHLSSLCKMFRIKKYKLYVMNSGYTNNKNIFKILSINKNLKRKDIYFQKLKFYRYLIFIFWKIISNKKTNFSDRVKILIYLLFIHPDTLIIHIQNFIRIKEICDKINFDLILAGSASYSLQLGYIISIIYKKKLVTLAHGDDFLVRTKFSLGSSFISSVNGVITSGHRIRNLIYKMHHIDKNKIKIIHYSLILNEYEVKASKEEIRREFNIQSDQFIIICVGRHVPRKRYDYVIQALNLIVNSNPKYNIKCIFIGKGSQTEKYKELVNKLKISEYVEFLGTVDILRRNKYYKLSDIFIMISVELRNSIEGFGIVFLEANYYNLPVIGSYSGGIVAAVEDGKTGFLINANDIHGLKEKIIRLYENKDLREQMGTYAHERVIKEYNWEEIIDEYIDYFKKILKL